MRLSGFDKSVGILMAGTLFSQALVIIASPLLTRLYLPSDFGMLSVYVSIVNIMLSVGSLRYELSIPISEDDETAANLLALSLAIVILISLFSGVIVFMFRDSIAYITKAISLKDYLWLLPFSLLGGGIYQALTYWVMRKKIFDRIAYTRIRQSIGQVIVQISTGIFRFGVIGLLLGDVVGRAAGTRTLSRLIWKNDKSLIKKVSLGKMLNAAKRYRRFPLISSGSALLNICGLQLPFLLFAGFYGPSVAGWLALGQRVMGAPMSLIGQSTSSVYMAEISQLYRESSKQLIKMFLKTMQRLFFVGCVPIVIIGLNGEWLFSVIFGKGWAEAGVYIKLLTGMYAVQFIVSPLAQTLNVLERQDIQFIWDMARVIVVLAVISYFGFLGLPVHEAVLFYGLSMLLMYVLQFVLIYYTLIKITKGAAPA